MSEEGFASGAQMRFVRGSNLPSRQCNVFNLWIEAQIEFRPVALTWESLQFLLLIFLRFSLPPLVFRS